MPQDRRGHARSIANRLCPTQRSAGLPAGGNLRAGAAAGFDLMTASLGGPIRQVQNGLTALRVDQHEQAPHFSAKNEPPLGL